MFQHFRVLLHAERCALLVKSETPFKDVGIQFDTECNDIVRPITDTLCKDQFNKVDWKTSKDPCAFVLIACILAECIDDPVNILVNTEIPFSETTGSSISLFVQSSNFTATNQPFGLVFDETLWSLDNAENTIILTLWEYVERQTQKLGNQSSFGLLYACCTSRVDNTNPFKRYLK